MIPAIFSAFKLSSLVFSKKYYAHGYQHENDISYFNFLLAHTASCLGAVRVTLSFFELYYQIVLFSIHFFISS